MRLPNNAISIANAVKIPKYIVGKKFEKTKGWLAKKLSNEINTNQIINALEERSIWQRYGF